MHWIPVELTLLTLLSLKDTVMYYLRAKFTLFRVSYLKSPEGVSDGLVRRLGDVDSDVDVGNGGGESHQEAHQVHHPLGRGERQQEPRGTGLEPMLVA